MKHPKLATGMAVLCLLFVVAAAPGTASAKVCSTSGTGTACGTGHGNVFTGALRWIKKHVSIKITFGSGFITVGCNESAMAGEVAGETGSGALSSLTFSGCSDGSGNSCTVASTASSLNKWPTQLTFLEGTKGKKTIKNITIEFTCAGVTCKYTSAEAGAAGEIVVEGGEPAVEVLNKVPLTKEAGSSFLCSNSATWSGEYELEAPSSLFIT